MSDRETRKKKAELRLLSYRALGGFNPQRSVSFELGENLDKWIVTCKLWLEEEQKEFEFLSFEVDESRIIALIASLGKTIRKKRELDSELSS